MNKPFRSADTEPPGCAKAFGGARLTHPCLQEVHSGGKREEIRGPLRTRGQIRQSLWTCCGRSARCCGNWREEQSREHQSSSDGMEGEGEDGPGRRKRRRENAVCPDLRALGKKTWGRWAAAKEPGGLCEGVRTLFIHTQMRSNRRGSVSLFACLFLTDLKRGENHS